MRKARLSQTRIGVPGRRQSRRAQILPEKYANVSGCPSASRVGVSATATPRQIPVNFA
jgi:hypothetical protein